MSQIVANMRALRAEAAARFAASGLCAAGSTKGGPAAGLPLDPAQFLGGFDGCTKPAVNGAEATYEGTVAAMLLDRPLVRAILPAQIDLAAPVDPAQAQHPVMFLLGRQNNPCALVKGQPEPILGAQAYSELTLLVPYTVRVGSNRWHSFSARMYLDDAIATLIGDAKYAYAKEIGAFDWIGSSATTRFYGNTVFDADVSAASGWMSEAQALGLPPYAQLRAILDMPIVGFSNTCGYVRSYFEWDCSNAEIAAATTVHRFFQEFTPGMQPWVDLGYLQSAANAAFKFRKVRWRLSIDLPVLQF